MKNINTNKLNYTIMKKTIIASKQLKNLGLHLEILVLNTVECTIERKTYYDGKISLKETRYFENDYILDFSWENDKSYYHEKEYSIITL